MYERVLVPYDGSVPSLTALGPAQWLAQAWDCTVDVVHVAPRPDADEPGAGVDHRVIVADTPAQALIGEASDGQILLCMSTRGRGWARELLLGSVASAVVRGLGKPFVLTGPRVMKPVSADPPRRMVVCLDGSTTAATMLPVARRWAEALATST